MSASLTCPYCNALLPAECAVTCPRCGEALGAPGSVRAATNPPGKPGQPVVGPPPSRGGHGLLWLALAAVVVAAGWAGWWWMDRGRTRGTDPRPNDPSIVVKP